MRPRPDPLWGAQTRSREKESRSADCHLREQAVHLGDELPARAASILRDVLPSEVATALAWAITLAVVLLTASAALADLRRLQRAAATD